MRARSMNRLLAWPFRSRLSSPIWLAIRFYLGWVWLQFGLGKIQAGWLTRNPLRSLLEAVAAGHTPAPFPFYRPIAALLVDIGADRVLTVAIPIFEVAVAIAFFAGVFLVPASIAAIAMNLNLVLAGIASIQFDGRIIALQLLLLVAWRVAGYVGLGTLVRRWWGPPAPASQGRSSRGWPRDPLGGGAHA